MQLGSGDVELTVRKSQLFDASERVFAIMFEIILIIFQGLKILGAQVFNNKQLPFKADAIVREEPRIACLVDPQAATEKIIIRSTEQDVVSSAAVQAIFAPPACKDIVLRRAS